MSAPSPGITSAYLATLAAGLLATAVWAAGDRPGVGGVERLEREATATFEADTRQLAVEDDVFFQDLLETSEQARLAVALADGTQLTLGENASLRIDEFVYTPDSSTARVGISVLEGAFRFVGGDAENMDDSEVEIKTGVGTLGVRGTSVWGGRIDGSFGVLVFEGNVTVRNEAGEVNLGPGEGTMVDDKDSPPSAPKVWPEEKVQRAVDTVRFREN
ncbi:MAG: FecR family protein [Gammaproteobacteria bacterium]|nr:FecR family protein [Gammaproteobacteria bacterium]